MILPYFLLAGQLAAFIALCAAPWFFTGTDWLIVLLMYFVGGCLGGSVTFHRLLSHRSWSAPAWWYYVGSLCGMIFLIGSPLAWANNHISHHRNVDTEKDPHSPKHMGWLRVQFLSMLHTEQSLRYGLRNVNPFQVFLHKHYVVLHMLYAFTLFMLGGLWAVSVFYLVPSAVIWHMASLINTVNHTGMPGNYRRHASKDSSFNNLFTGVCVWGEGWHNNHHAWPGRARFGDKWWELDISHLVIRILEKRA
jgi:fatty-acid desaturase